jgi:phenylacetate-CoA ligase
MTGLIFTKISVIVLNFFSLFRVSLPTGILEKCINFFWKNPRTVEYMASHVRSEELERLGRILAVHRFKKVLPVTPALNDFYEEKTKKVENYNDFKKLPESNKENYVKKFPLEYRCINGCLPEKGTLYKSAGTSGKNTAWAHSLEDELFFAKYVAFGLNYNYRTDNRNFKIINCWAFGTWPTAIDFTKGATSVGQMINVGTNMKEAIEMLLMLGKNYRYLIVGYPPFLSGLFAQGKKVGINWKDWYIHVLCGGESFVEEWREEIKNYLGEETLIYSAYGSTDLGLGEGMENALTVTIRRIVHVYQTFWDDENKARVLAKKYFPEISSNQILPKEKEEVRRLFLRLFMTDPAVDRRLPMIFQYDPTSYFNEEVVSKTEDGRDVSEMLTTVIWKDTAIPRVRYNIKDERGIIKHKEMFKILKSFNIDIKKVLISLKVDRNILHLPFFYIFGRSDGTISIDGANIFPADVEELIADNEEFDFISSFIMKRTDDRRLGFDFELKAGIDIPNNSSLIKKKFKNKLAEYSSGFKELYEEKLDCSNLAIEFFSFRTGPFVENPLEASRLVKYKYVRK